MVVIDVVGTDTRRGYAASSCTTLVFLGTLLAYVILQHESDALTLVGGGRTKVFRRMTIMGGRKGDDCGQSDTQGSSQKGIVRTRTDNARLAQQFGIKSTAKAPRWVWRVSFWLQHRALPVLYAWDPLRPPNYDLSLLCLWLKATSHKDPNYHPLHDHYLSYDMLPLVTRQFGTSTVFRPRLLRAIIELRSAYLQYALQQVVTHQRRVAVSSNRNVRLRLVSFGTGYDIRSIQLRRTNAIDDAYEFDRPEVMSIKQPLMERLLLRQNQRHTSNTINPLEQCHLPKLIGLDLNDLTKVQGILTETLGTTNDTIRRETAVESRDQPMIVWHTIFLFEGVMIYLNPGVPTALLRICSTVCPSHSTLIFADRLEHVMDSKEDNGARSSSSSKECASNVLSNVGWKLQDWCTKPGFARHMGIATSLS